MDFEEDVRSSPEDYVNRLMFQEASHVLLEGGRLIPGHRWKPGGTTDHLASRARELRNWRSRRSGTDIPSALIVSTIAWPDGPPAESDSAAQRMISEGIIEIRRIPPDGMDVSDVDPYSEFGRFCRIHALTAMRRRITELTNIRICLGGGSNKSSHRRSGIIEEARLSPEEYVNLLTTADVNRALTFATQGASGIQQARS